MRRVDVVAREGPYKSAIAVINGVNFVSLIWLLAQVSLVLGLENHKN